MTDVRQVLIDAGWKQGVILEPGPFAHPGAIGFLVMNQTCDCINHSFVNEPYLELLPLSIKGGKKGRPDKNFVNGKNPREMHFWVGVNGEQKCVVAKVREIELFDRSRHAELKFSESVKIAPGALGDILSWKAARYLRPAFPDSFEEAFRPLKDEFTRLLTDDGMDQLVDSILIQLDHYDDLEDENDGYQVELRLMVTPKVVGQPEAAERASNLAQLLEKLLAKSEAFFEPKCVVVELNKMTLWEARNYLDFSRYDYLSFGENE